MVIRIWHGWTTPEKADAYERLLQTEVIPGIESMQIPGFRGIEVLRRDEIPEVAFVTIMRFEAWDNLTAFVGEDYTVAHVPPAARALLSRFDTHAHHYAQRDLRTYTGAIQGPAPR